MRLYRWKGDETVYVEAGGEVMGYFRTLEDQDDYEEHIIDEEWGEPIEDSGTVSLSLMTNHNIEELI